MLLLLLLFMGDKDKDDEVVGDADNDEAGLVVVWSTQFIRWLDVVA